MTSMLPSSAVTAGRTRVCVFAKPPRPGEAKTRLAPALGLHGAAGLARALLVDAAAAVRALPWAELTVATTGALPPGLVRELACEVWPQGEGDLGARMERVLARAIAERGHGIVIGADAPGLPAERLAAAHAALAEADAVIGPAEDGGYYLLGLRTCPVGLLADLPWSAPDTCAATLARLRARGLTVVVLAPWFDLDTPADLPRMRALLAADPAVMPATRRTLAAPRISVVMPVLDEARRIDAALAALADVPGLAEVIVVDGGSGDDTIARARAHPVQVITAPRGRGPQLNAGAAAAIGDVLLFLHADTTLPRDAVTHVAAALAPADVVAGAFRTWTVPDAARPWFAPLLHLADVRSRVTHLPYGDQAMFVRAEVFRALGGFAPIPLMEDLELSRRLARRGRIHTCAASVRVSGRRFEQRPVVYTAMVNVFPWLYRLGVPPVALARLYRQVR